MLRHAGACLFLVGCLALAIGAARGQEEDKPDVLISAPISTRPLLTAAAQALKRDKGLEIEVTAQRISVDALDSLAQGKADIAFLTKPLKGEDRAKYPDLELVVTPIGMEVAALGISNDLWDAGVRTISQKRMQLIYEQKVKNWSEVGGPKEKITLFNFEEGAGVWEMLAEWLYGDNRKAPVPKTESVANSQDARDALEFTAGAIAPLGAAFVDGSRCHALAIDLPDRLARPVAADVASKSYPISRPIIAVTIGRPTLNIRAVTDYLTSPAGQRLVTNMGALGLDAVPKPPPDTLY